MSAPANSIDAFVALGSNLGDRDTHIRAALVALAALPGTTLVAASSILETEPVGPPGQGMYLNAVAHLRTSLTPRELLNHLLRIEHERGRDRASSPRWGSRTLDLDLLLFGDRVIDEPGLAVPHPHLRQRGFVLLPLSQLAPDLPLPPDGTTVRAALRALGVGTPPASPRPTIG